MTTLTTAPPAGVRSSLARLGAAQKGAQGAPAYSRFVNRRLGRLLAAVAHVAGLTPNAVTGLSACCTFTGIALLAAAPRGVGLGLAVAGLLVLGYALDSADGQLARLRGGGSPAGEWLDHVVDAVKTASLHLAVLVGLFRSGAEGPVLLLPLAASVVAVVLFFATLLNEALRASHGAALRATPTAERPSVLRSLLVVPTDYGLVCLLAALWGVPGAFLAGYALLAAGTAGYLLLALPRWYSEMTRLPR
jgi:phosphatidylglycerophosphate synthase